MRELAPFACFTASKPVTGYCPAAINLLITFVWCFAGSLPAQETSSEPSPFLEMAKKYIIESPSENVTLALQEKSLMNWTNPTRLRERGAIFVLSLDGRPLTIASLFTYEYSDKVFDKHEFHSLSTNPLKSTYDGKLAWTPKGPGIEWHEFKDSPEPGQSHTARSVQMRQLSKPFRAELTDPKEERTELRLVSRPLLEYSSPKHGVIDGAIFSFAVATDPEVLMLIEAFDEKNEGKAHNGFRYAFARFHYWNVCVFAGDDKIWEAPLDKSHELNVIGDRKNMEKVYNSYQPKP